MCHPRGGGVGWGAGESACKPDPVPVARQRPSISACRCRQAPAAYPQASGGQPSNACAGAACGALLALLRVGFTEPPRSPGVLVVSYTTVSPLPGRERPGGLFSVALSRGSPRVAVSNHPALWSPDFPRRRTGARRRGRPADSSAPTSLVRRCPTAWNGLEHALTAYGARALLAAWPRISDSLVVGTRIWPSAHFFGVRHNFRRSRFEQVRCLVVGMIEQRADRAQWRTSAR